MRTTGKNALPRAQVAPVRHSFPHVYTFTHFLKVSVRALRASLPRPGLRPRPSRARGGQGASPARRIRGFEKRDRDGFSQRISAAAARTARAPGGSTAPSPDRLARRFHEFPTPSKPARTRASLASGPVGRLPDGGHQASSSPNPVAAARSLRSSSLTALAPRSRSSNSYDGFQGRFHLLLHLRVCQRGSPRQARRPGASRPAPLPARSRAHRTPSPAAEGAFFFPPPNRPPTKNLGPRRSRAENARDSTPQIARTDFPIDRERTELTLIPLAPSRRADLRCRARRVPRRGPRLQGAFNRPFCATVGFRDDV